MAIEGMTQSRAAMAANLGSTAGRFALLRRDGRKDDGRRASGHGRGRALRAGSIGGRIGQGVVDVAEV